MKTCKKISQNVDSCSFCIVGEETIFSLHFILFCIFEIYCSVFSKFSTRTTNFLNIRKKNLKKSLDIESLELSCFVGNVSICEGHFFFLFAHCHIPWLFLTLAVFPTTNVSNSKNVSPVSQSQLLDKSKAKQKR